MSENDKHNENANGTNHGNRAGFELARSIAYATHAAVRSAMNGLPDAPPPLYWIADPYLGPGINPRLRGLTGTDYSEAEVSASD